MSHASATLETMTTISNLPRDLVEEIVCRVPLKHMRAVRLTCKKWNALFQSQSFTRMNIAKEEAKAKELGESRMIVMMNYNLHLMNIVVNENPSIEAKGKLTFPYDHSKQRQVEISGVYHCEGLFLLCISRDNECDCNGVRREDNTKVVVWNPYLGQTRWIKTSNNYRSRNVNDMYYYALGYSGNNHHHLKILRFIDDFYIHPETPAFLFEIYDFESRLWNTLDLVSLQWSKPSDCGVSLKGNTYWGAVERKAYTPTDHIIAFDFTSESFGPLLPLPFKAYAQFASLREEKLVALFQTTDKYKMEIWITTKVEVTQVSWSNFFTINMPSCLNHHRLSHKSFLLDEEKKVVMVFDKKGTTVCDLTHDTVDFIFIGESRSFTKSEPAANKMCWPIESMPTEYWPIVYSYVPSSVQIK